MKITVATSIAPHYIDIQQKAVASWLQIGFDVISVNSKEEIAIIKKYFPQVKFVEPSRNALGLTGKPYVFLDDVLIALRSTGSEVCAIINSDIYISANSKIRNFFYQQIKGGLIFGSRVDITTYLSLQGEKYFGGFDFFFFSRALIDNFHKSNFCLGVPWWDFWMPLFAILKGFPVMQLLTPFAYHLEHPIRWNKQFVTKFGDEIVRLLLDRDIFRKVDDKFQYRIKMARRYSDYTFLSISIINFINKYSEDIFCLDHFEIRDTKNCPKCDLILQELDYYKRRERQIMNFFEEQLLNTRTSLSWKITAPLRKIHSLITRF